MAVSALEEEYRILEACFDMRHRARVDHTEVTAFLLHPYDWAVLVFSLTSSSEPTYTGADGQLRIFGIPAVQDDKQMPGTPGCRRGATHEPAPF